MKRPFIAEHLINSPNCEKSYIKTIRKYTDLFDLIKLEAILFRIHKPKFNKHNVVDYIFALFLIYIFFAVE